MASSLMNVRNSLTNFYNITKLSSQPTNLLDELNNMEEANDNKVVALQIEQENDSEQEEKDDDDDEVEVLQNRASTAKPTETVAQSLNVEDCSEHESDDDVINDMHVTPGDIVVADVNQKSDATNIVPLDRYREDKDTSISSAKTNVEPEQEKQKEEDIDDDGDIPATFLFEIPTVEESEAAEKRIFDEFTKISSLTGETNTDLANLSNLTGLAASDHDEEDEKLMEITDPAKKSQGLAEVNANQKGQKSTSPVGEEQQMQDHVPKQQEHHSVDIDSDDFDDQTTTNADFHKPLKRPAKKRKLSENVSPLSPMKKKRKLDSNFLENDAAVDDMEETAEQPEPQHEEEINEDNDESNTSSPSRSVSVARNIGLNENQIENSLQKLYNMEDKLTEENIQLYQFQADAVRNSEHVTSFMIDECRQLLDLFGIPYITSPSEAEAQCATLNELGLVDGIITDDSDVFLFGGKMIYKHMFHMNKYVEKYTNTLVESKLGLTRKKMIALAMLLGSDYTDGIKGIGPVNGIEIVQTFCTQTQQSENSEIGAESVEEKEGTDEDWRGLIEFKKWIYSHEVDKKPSKRPDLNIQEYDEYLMLKKVWFKYKHRKYKKHWFVEQQWPENKVMDTYLHPNVDESDCKFEWGKPDITRLKIFCREKFEWDEHTINSTLDPIYKVVQFGRRAIQSSILSFADWVQPNKAIKSQRVRKAVNALIEEIELKKRMDAQRQNTQH